MWLAEESVHTAHCAYGPSLPHPTPHLSWATIGRTHDNCSAEALHKLGFECLTACQWVQYLAIQPLEVPHDGPCSQNYKSSVAQICT